MFNFGKKKTDQPTQPVIVHLVDAQNRANPKGMPFTLNSSELMGLLIESVQLAKLVTTEKRDLEVIRNDYMLRASYLEKKHTETITMIQGEYKERGAIIDAINERAKQLIEAGQFQAGEAIMNRMMDIIANGSPLRQAMELQNQRLLT